MLDLIEEPLDQVARLVKIWAEASISRLESRHGAQSQRFLPRSFGRYPTESGPIMLTLSFVSRDQKQPSIANLGCIRFL
jgi:hypothetical protein